MSRIADHVGRVLGGRYRLIAPIGTGGSAHVYLAEDSTLRRRVAVKLLHAALADDESFLRRFRAEAQSAAALNHPNIMRVYDWGEDEDGPYLVLEHLSGGSLRDALRNRRLTPAQAASVGIQAAKALDYAHRRNLVHRDIKPANLLFDDEGRLCIADFGVARALAEATWTEPTGAMVGTARYAAPEQARGGSLDGKADVYALALVLIESVTGEVPFQADTTIATLMARVDTPVQAPDELGPLKAVVEAAGRPHAAERPDAAEFARRLEAAARELPDPEPLGVIDLTIDEPARPDDVTEVRRAALFDQESADDDATGFAPLAPAAAGRRRRRWTKVLAVLLAVLVVAGAAYGAVELTTPTHPVPDLSGDALADARRQARELDLRLAVTRRFDEAAAKDVVLAQTPPAGKELKEGSRIRVVVSDGPPPVQVPSLAGLAEAQAVQALKDAGLAATVAPTASEDVAKGTVISWSPQGMQPKGSTITVAVSTGPPVLDVPNVKGMTFESAAKALADAGFQAVRKDDYSDEVPEPGKVVSTAPSGSAVKGTKVTVVVSKGPKTVAVPDLVGLTVEQARAKLEGAGLVLGNVYGPPPKRIFSSDPSSGYKLPRGSSVNVYTR